MSLELCILASGSSGNCSVVRTPNDVMLIDAGLGPRSVSMRLNGTGVQLGDISAICLTHLDSDHFSFNWINSIVQRGIRLFCHESRADALIRSAAADPSRRADCNQFASLVHTFNGRSFSPVEGLKGHAIALAHDVDGSQGFVIDGFGSRLGFATDLGRVPKDLIVRFSDDLDLIALESNYDPQMQLDSSRPQFLKNRIMGGRGHLSNQQAFDAIRAILDRCERTSRRLPEHIVLLHRSRQCNCPRRVRALFTQDARVAARLTLAEPFARSEWLRRRTVRARAGEQLALGFA